jgi:uncharacterized protein YkwD
MFKKLRVTKSCLMSLAFSMLASNPSIAANNMMFVPSMDPSPGQVPIDYYRNDATGDVWKDQPAWSLPLPSNGVLPSDMWQYGLRSIYLAKYACMDEGVRDWMPTNIANGIYYCTSPKDRQQTINYLRQLADKLEAEMKSGTGTTTTSGSGQPTTANSNEPTAFVGTVAAHNVWRQQVGVPNLTWSATLAQVAQAWADDLKSRNCAFEHRPNNQYGENIYWASGFTPSPKGVVDSWAGEIQDYNYANNSCPADKMCGHYTQVVWRNTQQVGCGTSTCDDGSILWVCNYNPPGNWQGQKPY